MSLKNNTPSRCSWASGEDFYLDYHDDAWGKSIASEQELFAMLSLELMQAGLSWSTVLKKWNGMHHAYVNFNIEDLAEADPEVFTQQLLNNPKVIRARKKIEAVLTNAKSAQKLRANYPAVDHDGQVFSAGLPAFIWQYVDFKTIDNQFNTVDDVPARTDLSEQIAKDLKKHGFKFVGPTITYAFMQAVGVVNDHVIDCDFR